MNSKPQKPVRSSTFSLPRKSWIISDDPSEDRVRVLLKPYFNQVFWVSGINQRYSRRGRRVFSLFKNVQCCTYAESIKPEEERTYLLFDHIWSEMTGTTDYPPLGSECSGISRVITYQRLDGTRSFGFRPYLTHTYGIALQTMVSRITTELDEKDLRYVSVAGCISKHVALLTRDIKRGNYMNSFDEIIYINMSLGTRKALSHLQKIERMLLQEAKRGNYKQIQKWFDQIVSDAESATDGYLPG